MDWFVKLVFRCWLEKLISGPNEVTRTLEKRAAWVILCFIITVFWTVKAQQYFLSFSYMFLDKKTVLKFGLILG